MREHPHEQGRHALTNLPRKRALVSSTLESDSRQWHGADTGTKHAAELSTDQGYDSKAHTVHVSHEKVSARRYRAISPTRASHRGHKDRQSARQVATLEQDDDTRVATGRSRHVGSGNMKSRDRLVAKAAHRGQHCGGHASIRDVSQLDAGSPGREPCSKLALVDRSETLLRSLEHGGSSERAVLKPEADDLRWRGRHQNRSHRFPHENTHSKQ